VVLVRGKARQLMIVAEAALAAGIVPGTTMGRPACAMIAQAMQAHQGVTSLGCIGNRVYTRISDDEMYFAIPGNKLEALTAQLETMVKANEALQEFHEQRRATLSSALP
jgi:uncharacterized protein (DUF169 family)